MDEAIREKILERLPEEARLVFDLDSLKDVVRQNPNARGIRKERVAEHSWYVAISVVLLAEFAPQPIDISRAVTLAVVHDTVEVFVGDTFAYGSEVEGKQSRERGAMERLRNSSVSPAIHRLVELWDEYEAQETPEARFVKGMDRFLPIMLNFSNIENSSWGEHGVQADQVRERLGRVRETIGVLADINELMINEAQASGYLE